MVSEGIHDAVIKDNFVGLSNNGNAYICIEFYVEEEDDSIVSDFYLTDGAAEITIEQLKRIEDYPEVTGIEDFNKEPPILKGKACQIYVKENKFTDRNGKERVVMQASIADPNYQPRQRVAEISENMRRFDAFLAEAPKKGVPF